MRKSLGEIKNHPIYDLGVKDKLPGEIKISGQNYKFLPAEYSTRSEINIFGDKIACFSGLSIGGIDKDTTIYITIDQTLAEGYKTWFKFVWMHLPTPD